MKAAAALLALMLGGCGSVPTAGLVSVPLPIECREPEPARPAMPTEALAPGVSLDLFVKSAQAEIDIREGYEGQLVTALRACRAPLK